MTEEPEYITEYHLIDEFLPPEPVQDAYWWWSRFGGFDEMYMILENDKISVEESAILSMLLKQRQEKLLTSGRTGVVLIHTRKN